MLNKSLIKCFCVFAIFFFLTGISTIAIAEELPEFTSFGQWKKPPPYKIGVSLYMSGIDWTSQWEYETKLALEMYKKAGIVSDYTYVIAQNDSAKQISDIEDLLAKGVDGLLVAPASQTAQIPILDRIYDEGKVPVVISVCTYGGKKYAHYEKIDDVDYGRVSGQWLVDKLNGKGNVIVLEGVPGHPVNLDRWVNGAKWVFDQYPGIKVVGKASADWDYAKGKAQAESLVAANPKIDGAWASGGQMSLAIFDVLLEKNRPFIPIAGEDYNGLFKVWKKYKDKGFDTIAPCKPTWMGRIAVQNLINVLRGMTVKRTIIQPCPYITWKNVDKFIRPDMPDFIWANTSLTDKELKKLFGMK
ncbi:MAG: ABC transporter substrate-binding protein [Deltaproteobacteria bacterium]|nr:ABC transporter substrate-binding protein [Deltaproteobacteria bacterium]